MGKILANEKLSDDFYLIEVEEKNQVKAGQFYMLRGWENIRYFQDRSAYLMRMRESVLFV